MGWRTASDMAKAELRRQEVGKRILAGQTYRRVAAEMGIAIDTVREDLKAVRADWRERHELEVDDLILLQLARLDVAIGGIMPSVGFGNVRAVDRL